MGVLGPTRMDYPATIAAVQRRGTIRRRAARAELTRHRDSGRRGRVAKDYYGTLGVARDASTDEIKRAYRKLARQYHPDVNPDPAAHERFKEISTAYEVLSDDQKRQIVDLGGDPLSTGGGGGAGAGGSFVGFQDIMDAFFGGGAARVARVRGPGPAPTRSCRCRWTCSRPRSASRPRSPSTPRSLCETCHGAGTAAGTHPTHLRHLRRPRRGAEGAAHVPRPGHDGAAVPGLRRLRHGHPAPVRAPAAATAGSAPAARSPSRSRPASRTRCGSGWPVRARSARAAARPATSTSRSTSARTTSSPARATTCTAGSPCR